MTELTESLQAGYFQRAMVEAAFAGLLCGVVGVHVILRRLPFYVAALSHATFPGAVAGSLLGVGVVSGAGVAGVAVAIAVGLLGSARVVDHASAVGVVLAGAFALGVVILTAFSDKSRDLASLLVGSILAVDAAELLVTSIISIVVVAIVIIIRKQLLLSAFDADAYVAAGYSKLRIDIALLVVIALAVAVMIPAVGTLLSLALLTVPAATARLWCREITPMTIVSAALAITASVGGLLLSAVLDVAAGGAIALTASGLFVASVLAQSVWRVRRLVLPSS